MKAFNGSSPLMGALAQFKRTMMSTKRHRPRINGYSKQEPQMIKDVPSKLVHRIKPQ
jgi:hypothetical protein